MNQIVEVEGYWSDQPDVGTTNVLVCIGDPPHEDDQDNDDIFYYTNGKPVNVGDRLSEFVVTHVWG